MYATYTFSMFGTRETFEGVVANFWKEFRLRMVFGMSRRTMSLWGGTFGVLIIVIAGYRLVTTGRTAIPAPFIETDSG